MPAPILELRAKMPPSLTHRAHHRSDAPLQMSRPNGHHKSWRRPLAKVQPRPENTGTGDASRMRHSNRAHAPVPPARLTARSIGRSPTEGRAHTARWTAHGSQTFHPPHAPPALASPGTKRGQFGVRRNVEVIATLDRGGRTPPPLGYQCAMAPFRGQRNVETPRRHLARNVRDVRLLDHARPAGHRGHQPNADAPALMASAAPRATECSRS